MGQGFSDIQDLPENFRSKELKTIFDCIKRSQSLQLIGLTGSGKSLFLKAISESVNIQKSYLGVEIKNFKIVLIDLKFCVEKDLNSILNFITGKLGSDNSENTNSLVLQLESTVSKIVTGGRRLVFIFDSFNEVPNPENLFKVLKALYDQHRGKLSYIFAVNHEVDLNKSFDEIKNITSILTENRIFISPLNTKDFQWFAKEQQNYLNQKLTPANVNKLFTLTGGYMATAKRIIEAMKDESTLEDIEINPEKIKGLDYHFQTLLKDLSEEKEALLNLINSKITNNDENSEKYLKKTFIIDNEDKFIIPLFRTYLENIGSKQIKYPQEVLNDKIIINSKLTSSEYKILKYLCNNLDKFCDREEIIENVWGANSKKGISDHALDQIVYRVRKKLERNDPQLKIETVWGRGHKAILSS